MRTYLNSLQMMFLAAGVDREMAQQRTGFGSAHLLLREDAFKRMGGVRGKADMDLKLVLSTFGLVFLAELGDKTQLATLSLAASGRSRVAVFLGSAGALILASGIAVVVGAAVGRVVPEVWIRRAAGVAFIIMGVLFLSGKG